MPTQNEKVRIIVLAMFLAGLTPYLQAQLIPGSVRGRITDPTSAIIPGDTVELRNIASGVVLRTVSNASGAYLFEFVTPGQYELTASLTGFKTNVRDFEVVTGRELLIDVPLELGNVSQGVTVTAAPPLLEAVDANRGQVSHCRISVSLLYEQYSYRLTFLKGSAVGGPKWYDTRARTLLHCGMSVIRDARSRSGNDHARGSATQPVMSQGRFSKVEPAIFQPICQMPTRSYDGTVGLESA